MKQIKFSRLNLLIFILFFSLLSQINLAYSNEQNVGFTNNPNIDEADSSDTPSNCTENNSDDCEPADDDDDDNNTQEAEISKEEYIKRKAEIDKEAIDLKTKEALLEEQMNQDDSNKAGIQEGTLRNKEQDFQNEPLTVFKFTDIMPEDVDKPEGIKRTKAELPGSGDFMDCQNASSHKWIDAFGKADWQNGWEKLYKKHSDKVIAAYSDASGKGIENFLNIASQDKNNASNLLNYQSILKAYTEAQIGDKGNKVNELTYNSGVKEISKSYTAAIEAGNNMLERIENCQGFLAATSYQEGIFEDPDYSNKGSKASFDGKIKCITSGGETQDYPGCYKMVNAYDALFVGRKVLDGYQAVDYAGFQQKERGKIAENEGKDLTISLKAQKNTTEKQKELATQKIATEGAALATLMGFYYAMPSKENLIEHCTTNLKRKHLDQIRANFDSYQERIITPSFITQSSPFGFLTNKTTDTIQGRIYAPLKSDTNEGLRSAEDICNSIIINNSTQEFIKNAKAKEAAKMAMVAAGVDIAKYGATIAILDKQSDLLDKAINKVDAFAPPDTTYSQDDLIKFECQVNPNLPKCPGAGDGLRDNGFYDSGINIGGVNRATSDANHDLDVADAGTKNSASGNTDGEHGGSIGSFGSGINKGNNSGGLANNGASAATVKKGGGGGGAGGGGAGGGGSAAPPSNPSAKGGQKAASPRGRKNSRRKYTGGGNTFKYGSARGSRSSRKKPANPFKNMFNKKRKGGKVLNYRGLASKGIGSKNGSLFEMLSHQYQSVNKRGRLIEYEQVK